MTGGKIVYYDGFMHHLLGKLLLPLAIFAALSLWFIPKNSSPVIGCSKVDPNNLSENYDPTATVAEFNGRLVHVPAMDLTPKTAQVLGEGSGQKRIEVDLASQHVYAYQGDTRVFDFVISSGKWAPTPKGTFTIQRKITSQVMSGGNRLIGTYYYLPNVPWVMFFGNDQIPWWYGYSFHGTYWHNNFGQPMSHGCVNMRTPDAEMLFNWAPVGTKVVVY